MRKYGIDSSSVAKDLGKANVTSEPELAGYLESQKYREVAVLAAALAFQERFDSNYKIGVDRLDEALRRVPNNSGYNVLARYAVDPNF